ncbi:MAG: EexN family lipoprotein [Ideonella sp.]|nr:EexN family lipoprotein [Ideonella sp.]
MQRPLLAITAALVLCVLQACSERQPDDTVESLMADPKRLKELQAQCKADHDKLGDAVCNRVAQAARRRFMAPAASPYAGDPVRPAPPAASATRD